jgi:hypothetical protein
VLFRTIEEPAFSIISRTEVLKVPGAALRRRASARPH